MSEVMDPMDGAQRDGSPRTANPTGTDGQASPATAVAQRPGLVTFAALMLLLMGGFSLVWAVLAFSQPGWLRDAYAAYGISDLGGYTWFWGLIDLFIAVLAVYAGVVVLRGTAGPIVQVVGLSIAGFSAFRWFLILPILPGVALTVIALDVLVGYGLTAHTEWFGEVRLP